MPRGLYIVCVSLIVAASLLLLHQVAADSPVIADVARAPSEHSPLKLIPWPKSVALKTGAVSLGGTSRIAATSPALRRLAEILSEEIHRTTGLRLPVAVSDGAKGDIVLRLNPALRSGADILTVRDRKIVKVRDYADRISIDDRVTIEGWDYRAVVEGTATLLQLLNTDSGKVSVPAVEILDWPQADFMGAMVDTGRQYNSLDDLKQIVLLCRAYKVRYLDLHLTDDQGWTFPSTRYPELGRHNSAAHGGPAPQRYDLAGLKALVKFADERGVTLVPKIEMPGHSSQARGTLPEIFGYIDPATGKPRDQGMMNLANPKLYDAIDTLIGEATEVFASSPYFDMGFDEVSGLPEVLSTPECKAFMKAKGLANGSELVKYFALTVNDMVKKRGKKSLVWEGPVSYVSPDIIVFTWDSNSHEAEHLQAKGIPTITVPWNLGVPWPEWSMFVCNGSMLKRTDTVLGACFPAWEQRGDVQVRMLRGIPARQERTWGPDNLFTPSGFNRRLASTDTVTDRLVYGFSIRHEGTVANEFFDARITRPVELIVSAAPAIGHIRFTTDGAEPTSQSPEFAGPYTIADSKTVKARLFNDAGEPVADTWVQPYLFDPLTIRAVGLAKDNGGKEMPWFARRIDVSVATATPGGSIRFTTDGSPPTADSPTYVGPVSLTKTATVKARWFDAQNIGRGNMATALFHRLAGFDDAAVGKPVTLLVPMEMPSQQQNKQQVEKLLTDGLLMPGEEWNSPEVARFGGSDMIAVIDLQSPIRLVKIGGRFLHCQEAGIFPPPTMEVSISDDGKTFTPLGSAHFVSPVNPHDRGTTVKTLAVDGGNVTARYVKIQAKNLGLIPAWHPVHGAPAHLMCDELFVNPSDNAGAGVK